MTPEEALAEERAWRCEGFAIVDGVSGVLRLELAKAEAGAPVEPVKFLRGLLRRFDKVVQETMDKVPK